MSNLEERPGYVGNLDEKTKPELLELLDRQEALLQNRFVYHTTFSAPLVLSVFP